TKCPAGTWCDHRTETCAPFCMAASDCAKGECVAAQDAALEPIPGANVCTAHCDPVDPGACGAGAACNYDGTAVDFDCFASQNAGVGAPCSFADCAPTLVCGGSTGCLAWCHPADDFSAECA